MPAISKYFTWDCFPIQRSMSVRSIVGQKCTLAASHAALWWVLLSMPTGQADRLAPACSNWTDTNKMPKLYLVQHNIKLRPTSIFVRRPSCMELTARTSATNYFSRPFYALSENVFVPADIASSALETFCLMGCISLLYLLTYYYTRHMYCIAMAVVMIMWALVMSTLLRRPNEVGFSCPSVRPYVRRYIRPQKVSSISMKFGM